MIFSVSFSARFFVEKINLFVWSFFDVISSIYRTSFIKKKLLSLLGDPKSKIFIYVETFFNQVVWKNGKKYPHFWWKHLYSFHRCSGFVTFWDGSGSLDTCTGLRILILHFSSVAYCFEGRLYNLQSSVADPDPHVFGRPGSGSISQKYGSGSDSGSFYRQAKIVRKTLIPSALWLLFDFLSLKII